MVDWLREEAERLPQDIPEEERPYRNMYQDMRAMLGLKNDPMVDIQAILDLDVSLHRKINYLIALKYFLRNTIKESNGDICESYSKVIDIVVDGLMNEIIVDAFKGFDDKCG